MMKCEENKRFILFNVISIQMNEDNLEYIQIKMKILVLLKGELTAIKGKSWGN